MDLVYFVYLEFQRAAAEERPSNMLRHLKGENVIIIIGLSLYCLLRFSYVCSNELFWQTPNSRHSAG